MLAGKLFQLSWRLYIAGTGIKLLLESLSECRPKQYQSNKKVAHQKITETPQCAQNYSRGRGTGARGVTSCAFSLVC